MGVLSSVEHIFNETAMQARTLASGNQSKSWSKSEPSLTGEGKSEENKGKSKGKSKGTKGAIQCSRGSGKGITSKIGISGLENLKSDTNSENSGNSPNGTGLYH